MRREINTKEFSSRIAILSSTSNKMLQLTFSLPWCMQKKYSSVFSTLYTVLTSRTRMKTTKMLTVSTLLTTITKTVIQVTVSATREKIENTLAKSVMKQYAQNNGYHLKFMFIGTKQLQEPKKPFANPYSIKFEYTRDCLYGSDLVAAFSRLDIKNQEAALLHSETRTWRGVPSHSTGFD